MMRITIEIDRDFFEDPEEGARISQAVGDALAEALETSIRLREGEALQ